MASYRIMPMQVAIALKREDFKGKPGSLTRKFYLIDSIPMIIGMMVNDFSLAKACIISQYHGEKEHVFN
jgi:hypothetical protein